MHVIGPDKERYNSIQDMCNAYGIKYTTYKARLRIGYSQEEALTNSLKGYIIGPDGQPYRNTKEMCKHYGVSVNTYRTRRKSGLSKKKALSHKQRE